MKRHFLVLLHFYAWAIAKHLPSPPQASSEGIAVCVPSFSVLAAATFSPRTRETPDFLSCCKKLSPIDRRLLSPQFSKAEKACGVPKSTFQNAALI